MNTIEKLLDICDFQGGTQPPKEEWISEPREGYVRMLQIRDYTQGDEKFIEYVLDNGKLHKCNADDIMLSRYGYIGQAFIGLAGAYNVALVKVIKKKQINTEYLFYYFKSEYFQRHLLENVGARATIPGFNKTELKNALINTPGDTQQEYIANTLRQVEGIMQLRSKELQALDSLIKAQFVEMFGDMLLNPKAWPEQRLDSIAAIVSGITKGRKVKTNELFEVPYMAVSNVKDGYIDWTTVKTIMATSAEIEQYRLIPEDVLMTEGGDPDKLGRGAIIYAPPKNCIHQNHIFRVRLDKTYLIPVYMAQYLQQQKAKRYFLGCAKQTTGIASINMTQLSALPVLIPPLELQKEYAAFVAQVDKSKAAVQKALDEMQLLFDSLMQMFFG